MPGRTERFNLAESNAYPIPNDRELGHDYFDRKIAVGEQRPAIAGVRLAVMLNEIFEWNKGTSWARAAESAANYAQR